MSLATGEHVPFVLCPHLPGDLYCVCGRGVERVECWQCRGDGWSAPGELHDVDPLWYDPDDVEPCDTCQGDGGWWVHEGGTR